MHHYNKGSCEFYFDTLHSLTVSQLLHTMYPFVSLSNVKYLFFLCGRENGGRGLLAK